MALTGERPGSLKVEKLETQGKTKGSQAGSRGTPDLFLISKGHTRPLGGPTFLLKSFLRNLSHRPRTTHACSPAEAGTRPGRSHDAHSKTSKPPDPSIYPTDPN